VPKKNGKSELAAALGLYLTFADNEPSALVVCAASSEEQADLVFDPAKTMCRMSPELKGISEIWADAITFPGAPGAKLKRVAAVGGGNDGKNLHGIIIDELHEFTAPTQIDCWNILTNGTGARDEPLVVQITTAGYDLGSICGQQYQYGRAIAEGKERGPQADSYFFRWYEAPEGCDYRDPAAWELANPSYNVTVREEFYTDQLGRKTEAVFRRYFLNQWTDSEEAWLPQGVWDACKAASLEPTRRSPTNPRLSIPAWVAVDAATQHDSCAAVLAQWQVQVGPAGPRRRLVLRATIWARPINPLTNKPLEGWTLPIEDVKRHLRDAASRLRGAADRLRPGLHHLGRPGAGGRGPADAGLPADRPAHGPGVAELLRVLHAGRDRARRRRGLHPADQGGGRRALAGRRLAAGEEQGPAAHGRGDRRRDGDRPGRPAGRGREAHPAPGLRRRR
jgi:hypothetical protein